MARRGHQARPKHDEPRAPRAARLYQRGLLTAVVAIPALSAAWGFHKGGAEDAMAAALASVFFMGLVGLDAVQLLEQLHGPRKPALWPHERLYWSVTAALAAATLVGVIVLLGAFDPIEEHGLDGYVDGFIAGVICAALVAFILARFHAWLMWLRGPQPADGDSEPSTLQAALGPTLTQLEAVRMDAGRHIRRRAAWLTPAGAGLFVAAATIYMVLGRDLNLLLPPLAILVGAIVGHVVASHRLAAEYERLYKARVLPTLAGLFGALTYQRPAPPDLARLRRFHVFAHFDRARADDAIAGDYRGLKLSIAQLDLDRGWGPTHKRVFQGLLIEVGLKNRLSGATAIAADAGALGNLLAELTGRDMQRVGLESAAFERQFQVYATDQVMARSLVTPVFMERFIALGELEGFGRPLALAQDDRLVIALPRPASASDYFSPPSYETPAGDNAVLRRLYHDLETILGVAGVVIDLDDATRHGAKRPGPADPAGMDEP